MSKRLLFVLGAFLSFSQVFGQTTATKVYNILQAKCVSCHAGGQPAGGLDLSGTQSAVLARLIDVNPTNAFAASKNYKRVFPGRWDMSFLFRKISGNLEHMVTLDANEGDLMPAPTSGITMTNNEKELIRQWIQHGAVTTGNIPYESSIDDYYNNGGIQSFPNGPPAAPDPSEGFQIKMGPFFIPPGGEVEWFQKYEMFMAASQEITRLNTFFSNYSHHFIMYNFTNNSTANGFPDGLRPSANHTDVRLVYAIQQPEDLRLPDKTAFNWANNIILDLNSHYINYDATQTLAAEVYINVYTQNVGIARQTMQTILIPNLAINIPNNGQTTTYSQPISMSGAGNFYVWGLMGHTHKYGTGYKVYKRNPNGSRGALLYDAACGGGIPNCPSPFFDYQHIPQRLFDPRYDPSSTSYFYPINMSSGFIHEASWVNNGPSSVGFGPTSDDEMMVVVAMYLTDTTGLNLPAVGTSTEEIEESTSEVRVMPNPFSQTALFEFPFDVYDAELEIFNSIGQRISKESNINGNTHVFNRKGIAAGLYYFTVSEQGRHMTGKFVIREE